MRFRGSAAAEHAPELRDALFFRKDTDRTDRRLRRRRFDHGKMTVRTRGDLRKMRDAENLFLRSKFVQFARNDNRRLAADVRIDFIKHQSADLIDFSKNRFHSKHHSRKLAAACDLFQRPDRNSRVRGKQKFYAVRTVRSRTRFAEFNFKRRAFETEFHDLFAQFGGKVLRRGFARGGQLCTKRKMRGTGGGKTRLQLFAFTRGILEKLQTAARIIQFRQDIRNFRTVFALERLKNLNPPGRQTRIHPVPPRKHGTAGHR